MSIKSSLIIAAILFIFSCKSPLKLTNKLKLVLTSSQDSFSVLEPAFANFKLVNNSNKKIGIRGGLSLGFEEDSDCNIHLLFKKNGKPIDLPKEVHYSFIKNDSIIFINKGEHWETSFDMTTFYPFNKEKGLYSVEAYFSDTIFIETMKRKFATKSKAKAILIK